MQPILTIASTQDQLDKAFGSSPESLIKPAYQFHPKDRTYVLTLSDGQPTWQLAKWDASTAKVLVPATSLLKQRPYNRLVRINRCVIPVNCFFGVHNDQVYLIRLLKKRTMSLAGVYFEKNGETHFQIIGTPSADILTHYMSNMPITFQPEQGVRWLHKRSTGDIIQALDKTYEQWFDVFPVASKVLDPAENNRNLLKPAGASINEIRQKEELQKALDVRQKRIDSGQSKR